jgi:fructokinase
VVDTVGAGDAFSAVLILGILEEWPLGFALDRAREFAEAVVGLRGATTTEPAFYSRLRTTWSPA